MHKRLDYFFSQSFCQETTYTLETASRCIYGVSGNIPPGAVAALAPCFGEDIGPLRALMRERRGR